MPSRRTRIGYFFSRIRARSGKSPLALLLAATCIPVLGADNDIVINEIMYNAPRDKDTLQFIELFNRGEAEVDVSDWIFNKGVQFRFPAETKVAAGEYLVICRDHAAFTAHYGQEIRVIGPFTGRLTHKGERVELSNARNQVIDSVEYSDTGEWPQGADGYASSLERISPGVEADRADNWASSPWPSSKRAAGSPGRKNDRYSSNLPPTISKVEFTPRTPAPQQNVRITAQVADSDGVESVWVAYRLASPGRESQAQTVAMTRSSGDHQMGTYEAELPGQAQGQLVRFQIKAKDRVQTERLYPAESEPRPAFSYFAFTNIAKPRIPQAFIINVSKLGRGPQHYERTPSRPANAATPIRGNGALLYVPAEGEPEVFDFVRIVTRHGGFKVHFQKDRTLKGMPDINLVSEGPLRWILAEPLAFALYRMAGVPAPLTEHVRLTLDRRAQGVHLLVEQPNEAFLVRNGRDPSGNLYKLIWYGDGIVGQHEKKTNPSTGHADLVQLIQGLKRTKGADQWKFIEQHFHVEEAINYYAVNMCLQNWDGFFNNYFAYHDTGKTGKWEIYPWDEDKTWGEYDGASTDYDWYEMPLTMGMNGDSSPRDFRSRFGGGGGPFGGVSWWRPPGYFSGPLLANNEFRARFLARLNELCATVFTEENLLPIIDVMEQRLEPEIRERAKITGDRPQEALREFKGYMQSFRNQVTHRRKFILAELEKLK